MLISDGLIEQHIHGAFGFDFMTCNADEIIEVAYLLKEKGVGAFFPTIMTDDLELIKERISVVKKAQQYQEKETAKIIGIHLEGPFINPLKKGIHSEKFIQPLNVEIFKRIEDDIIKIITLAPELDTTGEFIKYLSYKNIKLSAGHTMTQNLSGMNQVTHLYNAMAPFSHREISTTVLALYNDNLYTELIADSMHVSDEVLKITFRQKPKDKIILISDALPLAHSSKTEHIFAGQKIYNKEGKLVNKDGVLAGSSSLLCDIVKNLADKKLLKLEDAVKYASSNIAMYHNINNNLKIYWNDSNEIIKTEF